MIDFIILAISIQKYILVWFISLKFLLSSGEYKYSIYHLKIVAQCMNSDPDVTPWCVEAKSLVLSPSMLTIYMSHFAYACKMWYPLNLVLQNCEYLWFYLTFWVAILDCDLKLHKLLIHTLVMLQK